MSMTVQELKSKSGIIMIGFGIFFVLSGISAVQGQEIPYIDVSIAKNEAEGHDITPKTYFKLVPAINWQGRFWVVRNQDNVRIGYAQWNEEARRYTIFNLREEYRGFLQATVGTPITRDNVGNVQAGEFRQFLWYWPDNVYRMWAVRTLGGRPRLPNLPYGELGGNLQNYGQDYAFMAGGIAPLRRTVKPEMRGIEPLPGPMGIDISVIFRLPTIIPN
jgi:hypothetical protein